MALLIPIVNAYSKIRSLLAASQARGIKIKISLLGLTMLKLLSVGSGFLLVPMALNYLDPIKYGIWLTLGSIIGWVAFFDLGLSNGLRNKLGEALSRDDLHLARTLVSTALVILCGISALIYLLFWIINPFLDWLLILNAPFSMATEINFVVIAIFSFFTLKFATGLIVTVLVTDQRSALAESINTVGTLLSLIIVYFLTMITKNSLLYFAVAISATTALVPLLASIWFFKHGYRKMAPAFRYVDFSHIKGLGGKGLQFFGIQVAALILFTTDNIIIAQIFGPADVVPYNVAYKVFSIVIIAFGIVMTPFWAAYNEAYVKKDFLWIKRTTNKILAIWVGLFFSVLIIFFLSENIYHFWIGDELAIPISLSFFMAVFVLVQTFNMIFVTFIFSTGRLHIQIYIALIAALANIPLSYLFGKTLELGPAGVILATAVCGAPNLLLAPIQYYKLIHGRAKGIWGK